MYQLIAKKENEKTKISILTQRGKRKIERCVLYLQSVFGFDCVVGGFMLLPVVLCFSRVSVDFEIMFNEGGTRRHCEW